MWKRYLAGSSGIDCRLVVHCDAAESKVTKRAGKIKSRLLFGESLPKVTNSRISLSVVWFLSTLQSTQFFVSQGLCSF